MQQKSNPFLAMQCIIIRTHHTINTYNYGFATSYEEKKLNIFKVNIKNHRPDRVRIFDRLCATLRGVIYSGKDIGRGNEAANGRRCSWRMYFCVELEVPPRRR